MPPQPFDLLLADSCHSSSALTVGQRLAVARPITAPAPTANIAPETVADAPDAEVATTYTVKPGDSAITIARQLGVNVDELLTYKIDRRVALTVANAAGTRREVVLRPVNLATEKRLLYRSWVEKNREYVNRVSQGRLGYVHVRAMNFESFSQLLIELTPKAETQ